MIRSSSPGGVDPSFGQRKHLASKNPGPVRLDHRSSPAENQGLLARMDEPMDAEDYSSALSRAASTPADHDAGADWAQDEFERRHDRRQGVVQTYEYEDGPRIDSRNFPADKDW